MSTKTEHLNEQRSAMGMNHAGTTDHVPQSLHPQPSRLMFTGERSGHHASVTVTVTASGQPSRELPLYLTVRAHSPTGFEWGYGGSGPAQLALAMCIEVVGQQRAERVYQDVKDTLVAPLLSDSWMLSGATVLAVIRAAEVLHREPTAGAA